MRALFYIDSADWTGSARVFATAGRALAAQGWQTTYACCTGGSAIPHAERLGLEVVKLEADAMWFSRTGDLRKAIRGSFAEAVFVHTEREQLAATAAVRAAGRGAVIRRVPAGGRLTLSRVARGALAVAPTGFLFAWPEQPSDLPPDLDVLVALVADVGLDPEADPPAEPQPPRRPEERRIVCVYEPGARARAATVLRAVAMLAPRHPELRVVLVGPGSDDEALRMHAAALGVNRIVRHVGDAEDLATYATGAHLGWVVANGDDGAYGALDLMAARVPVLVDRGVAASRYVADGISGVYLEPGDVAGTAADIALLLAHEEQRQAMGAAGRARLLREYALAPMVDGFARAAEAARDRTKWRA
jgi:glycosyltransferase involved in cell wall biosynthesis